MINSSAFFSEQGGLRCDCPSVLCAPSPSVRMKPGGAIMRIATAMAVACVSVAGLAAGPDAQAVVQRYELNIPKQSLDTALRDLAEQTGLQIALFSDTIDGSVVVGPIVGAQSAQDAL